MLLTCAATGFIAVPELRVASLSIKTVVNRTSHKHEIVAISVLTHGAVNIEGDTKNPEKQAWQLVFCFFRFFIPSPAHFPLIIANERVMSRPAQFQGYTVIRQLAKDQPFPFDFKSTMAKQGVVLQSAVYVEAVSIIRFTRAFMCSSRSCLI